MKLQSKQAKKQKVIIISAVILAVLVIVGVVIGLVINSIKKQYENSDGITGITVSANPSKTTYYVGEEFDPTGFRIQVLASTNEASYFVDYPNEELKLSGFDSSKAVEDQVITVTYREYTDSFTIDVIEVPPADPVITGIRLSDNFTSKYTLKWWNTYGPAFDGVKLVCTYSDGTEKEVAMKSSYCYGIERNLTSAGTTEFTIKYSSGGILVETTVTITITN